MKITFLGTRGSNPAPATKHFSTIEYGGNSTCILVEDSFNKKYIVDAGTGIAKIRDVPLQADIFLSHPHYDHLQGLQYLSGIYHPESNVRIFGKSHANKSVDDIITEHQTRLFTPATRNFMQGLKSCETIGESAFFETSGMFVSAKSINHPGGYTSYKFHDRYTNKVFVVATDFEPSLSELDDDFIEWIRGSDFVVMDGQYELGSKENDYVPGFGHSYYEASLDLAKAAGVSSVCLTHHSPKSCDEYLRKLDDKVQTYGLQKRMLAFLAKEDQHFYLGDRLQKSA